MRTVGMKPVTKSKADKKVEKAAENVAKKAEETENDQVEKAAKSK